MFTHITSAVQWVRMERSLDELWAPADTARVLTTHFGGEQRVPDWLGAAATRRSSDAWSLSFM